MSIEFFSIRQKGGKDEGDEPWQLTELKLQGAARTLAFDEIDEKEERTQEKDEELWDQYTEGVVDERKFVQHRSMQQVDVRGLISYIDVGYARREFFHQFLQIINSKTADLSGIGEHESVCDARPSRYYRPTRYYFARRLPGC